MVCVYEHICLVCGKLDFKVMLKTRRVVHFNVQNMAINDIFWCNLVSFVISA